MKQLFSSIVFLILPLIGCHNSPPVDIQSVVVEKASPDTLSIQRGDLLTSWRLPEEEKTKPITSPYDLHYIFLRHGSGGKVIFNGIRKGQSFQENISGHWMLKSRPKFSPLQEEQYSLAITLLEDKETALEGIQKLDSLAGILEKEANFEDASWVMFLAGQKKLIQGDGDNARSGFQRAIRLSKKHPGKNHEGILTLAQGDFLREQMHYELAEAVYRSSLSYWKKDGDSFLISHILSRLGLTKYRLEDIGAAIENYEQAAHFLEKTPGPNLDLANLYHNLAIINRLQGYPEKSEAFHLKALEIRKQISPVQEALSLQSLGILYRKQGQLEKAKEYFERVYALYKTKNQNSIEYTNALTNMGTINWQLGYLDEGLMFHKEALKIREKHLPPEHEKIGEALQNIGNVLSTKGLFDSGEDYTRRALDIFIKNKRQYDIADNYYNLGTIAGFRGDYQNAEKYFAEALKIEQNSTPEGFQTVQSMANLAQAYEQNGKRMEAKALFRKAIDILNTKKEETLIHAEIFQLFGNVLLEEDIEEALVNLEHSLRIRSQLTAQSYDLGGMLSNLGKAYMKKNDLEKAEKHLLESLNILEKTGNPFTTHAETLYQLGRLALKRDQKEQARKSFALALDVFEKQREQMGGTQIIRFEFLNKFQFYFLDYLRFLVEQGDSHSAFAVLERYRARTFLSLLAERNLVLSRAPESLRQELRTIATSMNQKTGQLFQLSKKKDGKKIKELELSLENLAQRQEKKRAELRYAALESYNLSYPKPIQATDISEVIDDDTAVLSYCVTEDATYLFALTSADFQMVTIPKKARALRNDILDLHHYLLDPETASSRDYLRDLSEQLFTDLLSPALEIIEERKRVLIIPDGPLLTLPFNILRGKFGNAAHNRYFFEWKPLHYVSSLTVLRELKKRTGKIQAPYRLVAFGNPQYLSQEKLGAMEYLLRTAPEIGALAELPAAQFEVDSIGQLFGEQAQIFTKKRATEEAVKKLDPIPEILHFSCHAFTDVRSPLNSYLALSLFDRDVGGEDGLLRAWEIIDSLEIPSNLVVLSACECWRFGE